LAINMLFICRMVFNGEFCFIFSCQALFCFIICSRDVLHCDDMISCFPGMSLDDAINFCCCYLFLT
jgi:hypothetical protein